jgi:hypothetical protein
MLVSPYVIHIHVHVFSFWIILELWRSCFQMENCMSVTPTTVYCQSVHRERTRSVYYHSRIVCACYCAVKAVIASEQLCCIISLKWRSHLLTVGSNWGSSGLIFKLSLLSSQAVQITPLASYLGLPMFLSGYKASENSVAPRKPLCSSSVLTMLARQWEVTVLYVLKVTIICMYIFCDFGLKHTLRVQNFAICTRKWYRVDKS